MGGKAALLLVLGFSLIFAVVNFNTHSMVGRTVDNFTDYYTRTNLHNIAVSGAYMAANKVFEDPSWNDGFSNIEFANGNLNVYVSIFDVDKIKIESRATYLGKSDLVKIILQPASFAKYGYYANYWPGWGYLVTGDTVDGPFHVQGRLNTLGSPTFTGKVTTRDGLYARDGSSWGYGPANPEFLGGYESPVDVPFTLDPSKLYTAAAYQGRVFQDPSGNALDLRLEFNDDGTVDYQTRQTGTSSWSAAIEGDLDTLAPNGVIWNQKGNLYVSGTINGEYTIGTGKDGSNYGVVYIEDDVLYREEPLTFNDGIGQANNACTDRLGIVATKQVVVKDNAANRDNVTIHAALFNYDGGITVENISSSSPDMGIMRIYGSLIENAAQVTGYTNGAGYNQVIKFDRRFAVKPPPFFPGTETYEVVSWFE